MYHKIILNNNCKLCGLLKEAAEDELHFTNLKRKSIGPLLLTSKYEIFFLKFIKKHFSIDDNKF